MRPSLASLTLAALLGLATALPAAAQTATGTAAPRAMAPSPAATGASPAAGMTPAGRASAMPAGPMVNVNTASAAQLDALPMIGAKRAASIIAHRPYRTPDELVSKKAVSQGIYEHIKTRVTAG